MMSRRGLLRAHSHWRQRPAAPQASVGGSTRAGHVGLREVARRWVIVIVLVVVGFGVWLKVASRSTSSLPGTATGWLDSFTAAVARDPNRLCSELVTAAFRAALRHDLHESCVGYYSRVRGEPIRILRVLQTGNTAALEIRYWPRGPYSRFVLDRDGRGWRAVAIVPGGPLPVA
jgi:hypothetical protein